ncbi:MAG: isoprenylcysteine carboxylmethyltransferase family protein [Caulobacterales bacterium]|nr:isoprenylcysteine carboxylmethyltransferase family protein [Caulobacterales bacterium]
MLRMVAQTVAWVAVVGVLLFWPAGRLDWPQAWVFLAIVLACSLGLGFWLARRDPGLLRERLRPVGLSEPDPVNRAYITAMMVGFHLWFVWMGLEARHRESQPWPAWAQALGAAGVLACLAIAGLTFRENSFAAATIKLQAERGQRVIDTGPYAVVRHPMYAGAIFWMFGMPLLIGGPWDLLIGAAAMAVVVVRLLGEERMLAAGLPGYSAYMRRVRWRLVPGIW